MQTGSTGTALRKVDLPNDKTLAVGFQKLAFAHKAAAGDTLINLSSLTTPPEMTAFGFLQPTTSQLAAANLLFYKNNLTLVSSSRGILQQNFSYRVSSSTQLALNFSALEGEVFTGTIDYAAQTGIKVVDATATPATGTLAAGATDFNIGQLFATNKYSTTQVGACTVYLDGVQRFRNPGNSASVTTGDYYEVDNGSGSFTVIRFNQADPDNARSVLVIPTGLLSERPDGSMMAVIEALQGQFNVMAPYVAALAGLPSSTILGSAPTNVDLKAFGDRVLAAEQEITALSVTGSLGTPKLATTAVAGAVVRNKAQTKFMTASVTGTVSGSGAPITDLSFNALVVGKVYRLSGQAAIDTTISNSGTQLVITNGGVTLAAGSANFVGTFSELYVAAAVNTQFVATATTILCYAFGSGGQVKGANNRSQTFLTLEECNNTDIVTDFT